MAFGVHVATSTLFLVGAARQFRKLPVPSRLAPFTQVTPAYEEASNLGAITANVICVRGLGQPVVLIDDGSTDGSGPALHRLADANEATLVTMPLNSGKAAALNAGLAMVSTKVILTLDADTTTDVTAAQWLCGNIGDNGVCAIAFHLVPAHPITGLVAIQRAEYAYIQTFERTALAGFGLFVTVPGAASLWWSKALLDVGGFSDRTLSEDTDMTLELQANGGRVILAREWVAVTDCPRTIAALVRQRARWTWGNLQAGMIHGQAAIFGQSRIANRLPGLAMALLCAIKLAGFGIVTLTGIRLAFGMLGPSDLAPALAILASTVMRFAATRALVGSDAAPPVAGALLAVTLMQLVNLYAFWWGLFRAMPWRRRW